MRTFFQTWASLSLILLLSVPDSFGADVSASAGPVVVPTAKTVELSSPFSGEAKSRPEPDVDGVITLNHLSDAAILQKIELEKVHLSLVAGRSQVMRFSKPIARISISDPKILDFTLLSSTEALFNAISEGAANIILWDEENVISVIDVSVTKDPRLLYQLLRQIDPNGKFEIYSSKDVFVIKGETDTADKAKEIEKAGNAFAEGSVSLVQIKNAKQIVLQVRFLQVDQSQDYDFGVDFQSNNFWGKTADGRTFNNLFRPGQTGANIDEDTGALRLIPEDSQSPIYSFSYSSDDHPLLWTHIKALEQKGIVKTIARPNLLARDGEEAEFVVGGEAAILTSSNSGTSVQYKEFGTKLKFTPVFLGERKLRLTVAPEVSALNNAAGVQQGSTFVPGFSTSKAKTIVELNDGESLVIGGLIQQKLNTTDGGIPGLRRMPVIGKLFQSMNHQWDETELIVVVTPQFVRPDPVPISENPPATDSLATAVKIMERKIPDEHAEGVVNYIQYGREKKNFSKAQAPMSQTEGEHSAHTDKNPGTPDSPVEIKPEFDLASLDELEKQLLSFGDGGEFSATDSQALELTRDETQGDLDVKRV